jgi:tRNA(Arg) A34 adenosine deaminase TadA
MAQHEFFIKKCHQLAIEAGKNGDLPFGAVLVSDDKIIMTAQNSVISDNDSTRHAELNLIVKSQQSYSREFLQKCTLYASTAPCLMCTAAIWSAGITKIVYSVSYETYAKTISGKNKYIKCDEVYRQLNTEAEIIEGVLEKEGLKVYDFWPKMNSPKIDQ